MFYIDEHFTKDNWATWIKESGLMKLISEPECRSMIVPLLASKNVKNAFGLAQLKSIKLHYVIGNTPISELQDPVTFSASEERYLRLLKEWYVRKVLPKYNSLEEPFGNDANQSSGDDEASSQSDEPSIQSDEPSSENDESSHKAKPSNQIEPCNQIEPSDDIEPSSQTESSSQTEPPSQTEPFSQSEPSTQVESSCHNESSYQDLPESVANLNLHDKQR